MLDFPPYLLISLVSLVPTPFLSARQWGKVKVTRTWSASDEAHSFLLQSKWCWRPNLSGINEGIDVVSGGFFFLKKFCALNDAFQGKALREYLLCDMIRSCIVCMCDRGCRFSELFQLAVIMCSGAVQILCCLIIKWRVSTFLSFSCKVVIQHK